MEQEVQGKLNVLDLSVYALFFCIIDPLLPLIGLLIG
jgi:hypothetical protein